jgi:hypothetical protein
MAAAPASKPQTGNCGVNFQLNGASFSASNTCSDYLATANVATDGTSDAPVYNYSIALFDRAQVLAPLAGGLKNLSVDGDFLTAKVGTLTDASNVTLKLYVERKRFLKKDVVLIDRALKAGEFTYQAIDEKTGTLKVNLDKLLGGFESDKKHDITLSLSVALPAGTVISGPESLPATTQSSSITIH